MTTTRVELPRLLVWSFPVMALALIGIAIGQLNQPPAARQTTEADSARLSPALVEAEAQKLLQQAQKDVQSAETACFGQPVTCALNHYEWDARVRLAALKSLQTNLPQ